MIFRFLFLLGLTFFPYSFLLPSTLLKTLTHECSARVEEREDGQKKILVIQSREACPFSVFALALNGKEQIGIHPRAVFFVLPSTSKIVQLSELVEYDRQQTLSKEVLATLYTQYLAKGHSEQDIRAFEDVCKQVIAKFFKGNFFNTEDDAFPISFSRLEEHIINGNRELYFFA